MRGLDMERADKAKKLMACALKGLELAIAQCKPGARFRDLGEVISGHADGLGFG